MYGKIAATLRRRGSRATHRFRISIGFLIIAALIGIGVVPVRRGLTVRYHARPQSARASRPNARSRRRRRR